MKRNHVVYPATDPRQLEELCIERGEGIYVYDSQGNRYLEGLSGLWCTALGYGNRELIEAARAQMERLSFSHLFGGKTHPLAIELADRLADMLPMRDARIFFGNSGSDANDTQIKLLHYYFHAIGRPEKRKIIARDRSYHGLTLASSCLTGMPIFHEGFGLPTEALGVLRTDHPHYYRGRRENESEQEFVDRIVGNLEDLILEEGAETIAAFIAEPITGASGVIVPPPGYYSCVRSLLREHDILFWDDEVITGFGRTGEPFGCQTMEIDSPDLVVMAKQLSSAYVPISAAAVRGEIHEAISEFAARAGLFGHGYTYSGHPVGAAVALKTLEIYERDGLFRHAAQRGERMQAGLRSLSDHALVGEVRGKGLLAAVELVADKETGSAFETAEVGRHMISRCQEHGLILRAVAGNSIAFCPPLVIEDEQIDDMIVRFQRALEETHVFAVDRGLLSR